MLAEVELVIQCGPETETEGACAACDDGGVECPVQEPSSSQDGRSVEDAAEPFCGSWVCLRLFRAT